MFFFFAPSLLQPQLRDVLEGCLKQMDVDARQGFVHKKEKHFWWRHITPTHLYLQTTKMSAPTSVPLSASNARSFVDSTDTFIFDCDGVLWKTHHLLPGVAETMDMLRAKVWSTSDVHTHAHTCRHALRCTHYTSYTRTFMHTFAHPHIRARSSFL